MWKYYLLVVLSILLNALSSFFFKKGVSDGNNFYDYLNVNLFYGLSILSFSFILYYLSLSKININIVYPTITAFSVILITLMSYFFFNEALTTKHIIAIVIILFGVILMYL